MVSDSVFCPSPEVGRDRKASSDVVQARGSDLSGCEDVLTQKLKSLELQNSLPGLVPHRSLALDPSCLLTPPNTPQGGELAEADMREGARPQHKGSDSQMIRTRVQSPVGTCLVVFKGSGPPLWSLLPGYQGNQDTDLIDHSGQVDPGGL